MAQRGSPAAAASGTCYSMSHSQGPWCPLQLQPLTVECISIEACTMGCCQWDVSLGRTDVEPLRRHPKVIPIKIFFKITKIIFVAFRMLAIIMFPKFLFPSTSLNLIINQHFDVTKSENMCKLVYNFNTLSNFCFIVVSNQA